MSRVGKVDWAVQRVMDKLLPRGVQLVGEHF